MRWNIHLMLCWNNTSWMLLDARWLPVARRINCGLNIVVKAEFKGQHKAKCMCLVEACSHLIAAHAPSSLCNLRLQFLPWLQEDMSHTRWGPCVNLHSLHHPGTGLVLVGQFGHVYVAWSFPFVRWYVYMYIWLYESCMGLFRLL